MRPCGILFRRRRTLAWESVFQLTEDELRVADECDIRLDVSADLEGIDVELNDLLPARVVGAHPALEFLHSSSDEQRRIGAVECLRARLGAIGADQAETEWRNDQLYQFDKHRVRCDFFIGQMLLEEVKRGDTSGNGEEGNEQFEESCGHDACAGIAIAAGA